MIEDLTPEEAQRVLRALLRAHADLVGEAEAIARCQWEEFDALNIAEAIVGDVLQLDIQDLNHRTAYPEDWVSPGEAAWQLCDEVLQPWQFEWDRMVRLGRDQDASEVLQGILLGLYRLSQIDHEVLNWCPDYPSETAKVWSDRVRKECSDLTLPPATREQLGEWSAWFD